MGRRVGSFRLGQDLQAYRQLSRRAGWTPTGMRRTFLQLPVQSGKNEFGSDVLTESPPLRMRRIRL